MVKQRCAVSWPEPRILSTRIVRSSVGAPEGPAPVRIESRSQPPLFISSRPRMPLEKRSCAEASSIPCEACESTGNGHTRARDGARMFAFELCTTPAPLSRDLL